MSLRLDSTWNIPLKPLFFSSKGPLIATAFTNGYHWGRPIRVQNGRWNSRACEPWAPLMTWRAFGTNPIGVRGPSWLRSGVSTFSFSLFSTNITFSFSSSRIFFLSHLWYAAVCLLKEKKWRKKHCQNNIVWLYARKHARNFVSPDFYFDKFFCISYVFFADCVFMFLLYSCCNGWCRERKRKREEHETGKKVQDLFAFKTNLNNTEQIHENESNVTKQDRTKMYILVVFTQHL